VVPFLGAGVNLCIVEAVWPASTVAGQTSGDAGSHNSGAEPASQEKPIRLPSGGELAHYLAKKFAYSAQAQVCTIADCITLDLACVSQYGATMEDEGPLYDHLKKAFEGNFKPTVVHEFLAHLPPAKPQAPEDAYPLSVTTNYADLMEQAMGPGNCDLV